MGVDLCIGARVIMEEFGGRYCNVIVRNGLSRESCEVFENLRFIEL